MHFALKSIALILLAGCTGTSQTRSAEVVDYTIVSGPTETVSQNAFVQAFSDICLRSEVALSTVDAKAERLGMTRQESRTSISGYVYRWSAPKDNGLSPLQLQISDSVILFDLPASGDGADLPSRSRRCTLEAYIDEPDESSRERLQTIAAGELTQLSDQLDFSLYSNAEGPNSEFVSVRAFPPSVRDLASWPIDRPCDPAERCGYYGPAELTLNVSGGFR